MSHVYLDSSALVKRYLSETGSAWIGILTDPTAGDTIVLAEMTQVEVAAALASRHRAGGISRRERDDMVNLLAKHCQTEYTLIATNRLILHGAIDLALRHRLRGYDESSWQRL